VRCQEARTQKLANQDYAQVRIQTDGSSLCFCVCDGVGSSYKGDFAAQYLAKHLMQWMHSLQNRAIQPSATLAADLTRQLDLWAIQAQERLRRLTISEDVPGLVREVLEELRDTYGSETVFLCGRIDQTPSTLLHADEAYPDGAHLTQLMIFWMGNVTAQLFTSQDHYLMLGMDHDATARWSTLLGARGPIAVRNMHLPIIERLIVHTDGLDSISPSLSAMDDAAWQSQVRQLLLLPRSDDMTALDIRWLHRGSNPKMPRSDQDD
jgi:hypothetical protein